MSFLKRLLHSQPEKPRTSTPSEKCQETNVKSKNMEQGAAGSADSSHDELSLFTGMTFSSQPPAAESNVLDKSVIGDEEGIQESEELREIFENLEVTKGDEEIKESTIVSKNKEENKDTSEKEHQQEPQASLSGQQGKKKKRIHAKRPGYARDNQNISHPKPKATVEEHAISDYTAAVEKTEEIPIILEADNANKVQPDLQPRDDAENGSLEEQTDIVDQFMDKGNKTVSKQGIQNLYSIDTPTSSEENLVEIEQKEQEFGSGEKTLENTKEDEEVKEDEDCTSTSYETEDMGTSGRDVETTLKTEGSMLEHVGKDGVAPGQHIPVMFAKLNEEKNGTSNSKEESGKKNDQTYDLQLDAEERSSLVEQDMEFRMSNLREEEEILQELEHELLLSYSNSGDAYLDKQKELQELTCEESKAVANDNYDLAEELSWKIEELKECLEKAKYKLPAVDSKVQQALQLRSELSLTRLSILRDAQVSLEQVREEQASSLDAFNEENSAKFSKEKQTLNTERQRLDRARAHLHLDMEHLDKEQLILEEEIQQRTKEFLLKKECLTEEREKIRDEIAAVQRKLEQLRACESQCSKNIQAEELKIKEITDEFSPQKEPLNKQRKELENQRNVLDTEQESLNLAQESFNKLVESWSTRKERSTGFLNSLQATISSNVSSIDVLEKQRGEIEEFLCLKHLSFTQDATLDKLRSSVKQTNQQIKSLTSKITLSERNIASLRKRVAEIEDQISDRNEAKDIAKKERNFKEAKRLKEESETLKAEGIESQDKLERLLEELNQDTVLLQTKEKGFKKTNEELEEIEYQSDLKLVNSAAKVIKGLQEQITRYKDNEFLHTLLAAEISTCQNLINELCSKHSISAPIMEESQPQDDASDTDETEDINKQIAAPSCGDPDVPTDEDSTQVTEVEETKEDLLNRLDEFEGKLEAVIDMEDFDEADRIQQEIIQVKSKLEERS